ncbi:MAG: hypothetical protein J1G30_04205 [Spirochaetales bacterium]|nr:hypothetical protein [Spirochaetales bacterium]
MMHHIVTVLPIIISVTTLITFFRNEIQKQREYGKFLKEIEITTKQVQTLKDAIRAVDARHRKWLKPIEKQLQETRGQVHSLDKLTNELFVRLDSISSSIEEIKELIKK